MDTLALRIAARWAKKRQKEVPVVNKDKERVVYVLPETVTEESETYQKVPPSRLDSDGHIDPHAPRRRQQHLPVKPQRPHRPEIPRVPPPSPPHPPMAPKPPMAPRKMKPVRHLKPPKVPKPLEPNKYKRVKRYMQGADDAQIERVARILDRYEDDGSLLVLE